MKISLSIVVLLAAGLVSTQGAELTISGFGTSEENPLSLTDDLQGQWQGLGTQTATAVDLTNVSNESDNDSNGIFSDLTTDGRSPVDIGTNTAEMVLTATLTSAPPKVDNFIVSLFDANFNELDYVFHWSAFESSNGNPVTVIADLQGGTTAFDGTVASYAVSLTDSQDLAPDTLSIDFFDVGVEEVPEPSSYTLLLLGVGGVSLAQRRARLSSTARR